MQFPDAAEHKPTALIVDDEALIRMALSDFLQESGFKVFGAADGASAVQALQSFSESIDIVVTDVRMPGDIDGFKLARWIREHCPDLPVVIVSGDRVKAEVANDLCDKANFFPKPYDFHQVIARMRQIIDRRSQSAH